MMTRSQYAKRRNNATLAVALLFLFAVPVAHAQEDRSDELPSLAEIDRQLNNPLASLWSLTFQDNFGVKQGDVLDGSTWTNVLFFQPALPVPVGEKLIFIGRPVFPLVTNPDIDPLTGGVTGHTTGFGDLQLMMLLGPSRTIGWVWGAGATFKFPTAAAPELGSGKYQLGPALMLINMGKPWVYGFLWQHWESVAGDDARPDVAKTDFQYIARYALPNAWSVGAGPTITVTREEDGERRWTVPVGLGVTKTVRVGKTPVKLRAEAHYSIVRPDDYGEVWNIRFQITPVIDSPFM